MVYASLDCKEETRTDVHAYSPQDKAKQGIVIPPELLFFLRLVIYLRSREQAESRQKKRTEKQNKKYLLNAKGRYVHVPKKRRLSFRTYARDSAARHQAGSSPQLTPGPGENTLLLLEGGETL